ncbi:MAG: monovalent cation/H+ antiporter complex subunit F [Acidimicrobiales bacterium]
MIEFIAIACFGFAAIGGGVRLIAGPGLADRIMALDVVIVSLMGAIAADAARRDDDTFLMVPVVLAVIGFTATLAATTLVDDADDLDTDTDTDTDKTETAGANDGA